jgi:molecular chaperone Hsp33
MASTPPFLDPERPGVPDIVVPRGIVPFTLPDRPVRGRLVRLGPLADALLTRHDNHPAVTGLAGQALALVAVLASALKFRGSFSLQAKGDGPLTMLLADCTDTGALRGYARADPERLQALLDAEPAPAAVRLLGQGYLAFTVDQGPDTDRHQGIVAIEGDTLPDMALHYFETSEQLRCMIRLACAPTESGWRASALILERVAGGGGIEPLLDEDAQEDAWHTATTLAATVTDAELLDDGLAPDRLLYRLFHTEGVAIQLPRALAYGCRCSRQRLAGVLERFGADDLDHMAIDGSIVMTCEFCNLDFRFDRHEVGGDAERSNPEADDPRA